MKSYFSVPLLFLFGLLPAMNCAHPQSITDIYGSPQAKAAAPQAVDKVASKSSSCQHDWECGDGFLCLKNQCTAITAGLEECKSGRVHFDFNATTLHPDEYPVLQRIARCLKADHKMHIRIDGNTDERGTLEYNLALGDERARTVAKYLSDLGVSAQQVATVTYGKDQPLCNEHTESCWHENRRAGLLSSR